jgi:hypothetical protein
VIPPSQAAIRFSILSACDFSSFRPTPEKTSSRCFSEDFRNFSPALSMPLSIVMFDETPALMHIQTLSNKTCFEEKYDWTLSEYCFPSSRICI